MNKERFVRFQEINFHEPLHRTQRNYYKDARREYNHWQEKLHIIDTYDLTETKIHFLNRINPLTYIFLIVILIIAPFYCIFTDNKIQEILEDMKNALLGDEI